jgi:2-polyprenyl-3-methyl-5-hydroxy-6-metoxy-1,4-benzoquinol methylase
MEVPVEMRQLKGHMRSTWMAGDFGRIAYYATKIAEEFVDRLSIRPDMNVLDVAWGTGNTAIPAARKGAHVTGVLARPDSLKRSTVSRSLRAVGMRLWTD